MTTMLFLSFALFAAYIATVIAANKGVPASVSDSFYILDDRKKGLGYAFTPWCWAVGGSVMMIMLELSAGERYQFLGLFAGGGLCFAGTAPLFKGHERTIHYVSAAVCALSATLWMILAGHWIILAASVMMALAVIWKHKRHMFWIEVALFVSAYISLFIKLYTGYGNI